MAGRAGLLCGVVQGDAINNKGIGGCGICHYSSGLCLGHVVAKRGGRDVRTFVNRSLL